MDDDKQEPPTSMMDEDCDDGDQTPSWFRSSILNRTLESESDSESEMPPFIPIDHSTPLTNAGGKESNEETSEECVKRDYSIEGYYSRRVDNRAEWERLRSRSRRPRRPHRNTSPQPSTSTTAIRQAGSNRPRPPVVLQPSTSTGQTSTLRQPPHPRPGPSGIHQHDAEEEWEAAKDSFKGVICFFLFFFFSGLLYYTFSFFCVRILHFVKKTFYYISYTESTSTT